MKIGSTLNDGKVADRINDEIRRRNSDPRGIIFRTFLQLGLFLALLILTVLLVDVVQNGWGTLSTRFGDFLSGTLRSRSIDEKLGVHQGLVGSFWIAVTTAIVAFPIGIGAAIYLEEYAPDNRLTRFIQLNIANLAGVPSVVYGLLGLGLFVRWFSLGRSVLAGSMTMALLILPLIIGASREAIRAVPDGQRVASYALGATKWQTVYRTVLPAAGGGILTGTILALARAIGETAPLITIGALTFIAFDPNGPLDLVTVLPIQIFNWVSLPQREFSSLAAGGIVILLVVLLIANSAALFVRFRLQRRPD